MRKWDFIPEPINLNPLKHHLGYMKSFINECSLLPEEKISRTIVPLLKHIGTSVADIYTGNLEVEEIVSEFKKYMIEEKLSDEASFIKWIKESKKEYRKYSLSDSSEWVIKHLGGNHRYFHIFPGRKLTLTVRSRGNSLKTAILYDILFDKGDIMLNDLNSVRKMLSLSPLRSIESASSIISDIRMLQSV